MAHGAIPDGTEFVDVISGARATVVNGHLPLPEMPAGVMVWRSVMLSLAIPPSLIRWRDGETERREEGEIMKILCVDVGTGTQDILLYDSDKEIENCLKMVMPSPTLRVAQRVKAATRTGDAIVLTGVTMGGGPSHWAVLDHVRAGYKVYATPEAARTFDDELDKVEHMGIRVVSDEEARQLDEEEERTIQLRDFDYAQIQLAFAAFGVDLDPDGLALAVFDHGNAPAGYSDRQFRFDYLEQRIRAENRLSAFAHQRGEVPDHLTRLKAVEASTQNFDGEVLLMDTAPAAVLGALLDPAVSAHQQVIVCNVGNFHTLAFRLGPGGIEGVFEHHTGEITREQTRRLHRQD